jgi:serine/threonine protein kinase
VNCQFTWKVKFPIVNDAAHSPGNNRHLPYLAPEQVNKQSEQPYRSCLTPKVRQGLTGARLICCHKVLVLQVDMWNLAAVLFHCLVGYAPFGPVHVGEDPTEGILRDEPFIPYAIPSVLRWIIQQGLTKPVQLRCSALDAWIALLQAEADELHSDSDAESCSLPMWARHDDESDSILAWPEDESPKWMVSTVPDVAGPSDQVAGDESLHCLGVFGRLTGASGSDTCSGSMFGMPDDFLHEAAHGLPTKQCSEIEHSMGLQRSESGHPLDTISSCPASPSCSHMHEKQLPVGAAGCSHAAPDPGASRGIRDIGFNKRSRQLIQHLATNPPREISTTTASLDTSDSSRDQHHTHRRAPRRKHSAQSGPQVCSVFLLMS